MADPPSEQDPRATRVAVSDEMLTVELADGRMLEAPIEWFPWLLDASASAIANFEIIDEGRQIEWSELGEKVSLSGLFRGIAALDAG
ncbi:MAG: DUF2442 domain-containing protein [Deltaproteobacteria bacterium]|nr:DUF2442 domain-containing protein [Deltaproteobacteria bacterium]MBW2389826.1 DUF2442 domain-containing protein [Deltaproteobacteria bacterium]